MTFEQESLLVENNKMLKRICNYIDKVESNNYRNHEDFKNMLINLIANLARR